MTTNFRGIFDGLDDTKDERPKYLSRLFGIFSERIVEIWARDDRAPYENLGRPTVKTPEHHRGFTLDFTFRERAGGRMFVSEMKCEIEYMGFRYFVLEASHQLDHHKKDAFAAFLRAARSPKEITVRLGGRQIDIDGAILVWGALTSEAKASISSERGFHDVLSMEDICKDLAYWQNAEFIAMIKKYRGWSERLFDGLVNA